MIPITNSNTPLCAYSNKNKLWVSLIEKAYLKVNGGYNFKGSTSSTDLYAFTSWLPEKLDLKSADKVKLWERIYAGTKRNDCMITISTGEVPCEDDIGLKGNHAYAVLEVIEEGGVHILLVKNPWGNFRWHGKYSTDDRLNWTEELKKKLHFYDLEQYDNGIFWIDFDSVIEYFENIDINWNPAPLIYRQSVWDMWSSANMSTGHSNLFLNPQFAVEFKLDPADTSSDFVIWGILTKIPDTQESTEDEDYIGLTAYENNAFTKILYSEAPINPTVLTNSQHYLFKSVIAKQSLKKNKYITLVVRQHMRTKDLCFR